MGPSDEDALLRLRRPKACARRRGVPWSRRDAARCAALVRCAATWSTWRRTPRRSKSTWLGWRSSSRSVWRGEGSHARAWQEGSSGGRQNARSACSRGAGLTGCRGGLVEEACARSRCSRWATSPSTRTSSWARSGARPRRPWPACAPSAPAPRCGLRQLRDRAAQLFRGCPGRLPYTITRLGERASCLRDTWSLRAFLRAGGVDGRARAAGPRAVARGRHGRPHAAGLPHAQRARHHGREPRRHPSPRTQ